LVGLIVEIVGAALSRLPLVVDERQIALQLVRRATPAKLLLGELAGDVKRSWAERKVALLSTCGASRLDLAILVVTVSLRSPRLTYSFD